MNISVAILGGALFGITALYSLLSLSVAHTRLPWLIQSLIIVATTLPLLIIRADDLMLIFLVTSFVVFGLSRYGQHRHRVATAGEYDSNEPRRPTISLKNLMFAVILFCVFAALFSQAIEFSAPGPGQLPTSGPAQLVGFGLAIGVWSFCLVGLVLGKIGGWRNWLLLLAAMVLSWVLASWNDSFGAPAIFQAWNWLSGNPFSALRPQPYLYLTMIAWLIFLFAQSIFVASVVWAFRQTFGKPEFETASESETSGFRKFNILKRIVRFGFCVSAASLFFAMLVSLSYCFVALLPPKLNASHVRSYQSGQLNGITELIKAGEKFDESPILNQNQPVLPGSELKDEIETYAATYEQIDSGLSKPNCTWMDWSTGQEFCTDGSSSPFIFSGAANLRTVARALEMRAMQSLHDERFDDVISDGIKCIRVSESLSIDPILLSSMIGTAIEGIGVHMTQSGIKNASETQLKAAAKTVNDLMRHSASVDEEFERLAENERCYLWEKSGWKDRLLFGRTMGSDIDDQLRSMIVRRDVLRSLLRTGIAAELYRHDHGRYPDDLDSMIPDYLTQVPIDLFVSENDRTPLRYSVTEDGSTYKLYSVGVNGIHENGFVDEENWHVNGDLDLAIMAGDPIKEQKEYVADYQKQLVNEEPMYDEEGMFDVEFEDLEIFEEDGNKENESQDATNNR